MSPAARGLFGRSGVFLWNLDTFVLEWAEFPPPLFFLPQTVNGVFVRSLKVNCKVTSRFAHYVITSQVVNSADEAREVAFDVEIPKTAFISDFAMCVMPSLTSPPQSIYLFRLRPAWPDLTTSHGQAQLRGSGGKRSISILNSYLTQKIRASNCFFSAFG